MKNLRRYLKLSSFLIVLLTFFCFAFIYLNDELKKLVLSIFIVILALYILLNFQVRLWVINRSNYNALLNNQVNYEGVKVSVKELTLILINVYFLIDIVSNIDFNFRNILIPIIISFSLFLYTFIKIEMYKFYIIKEMICRIIIKIFKFIMKILVSIISFAREVFLAIKKLYFKIKNLFILKLKIKIGWENYNRHWNEKLAVIKIAYEDSS
ncbi:hypothetical protein [Spiroplasma endosymbiont of Dioctria linearis]|uniref:hypothetical protein n=1 Tax=Spiroplasma endosymbiont of Dioctria linearis TaxID=3066290 RepID=UPI00313E4102